MRQLPHSVAINEAARRHLAPLGVRQKGRLRFWYDDRGWYLVGVEFQPGYGRGSYLNVGCCWLWHAKESFSFDLGYRDEEPFREFTTMPEWQVHADHLARRAAELVAGYRARVRSIEAIADHYERDAPVGFWEKYHAGIASGFVRRRPRATSYFMSAIEEHTPSSPPWMQEAVKRCENWLALLPRVEEFRLEVQAEIRRARSLMKLPILALALHNDGAA
jgi:hypothetical protein